MQTNDEFVKNLTLSVDEKKIADYQKLLGSYETGHACEKLWEICKENQ